VLYKFICFYFTSLYTDPDRSSGQISCLETIRGVNVRAHKKWDKASKQATWRGCRQLAAHCACKNNVVHKLLIRRLYWLLHVSSRVSATDQLQCLCAFNETNNNHRNNPCLIFILVAILYYAGHVLNFYISTFPFVVSNSAVYEIKFVLCCITNVLLYVTIHSLL